MAFIAPASKTYVSAEVLAEQRLEEAQAVDDVAARDAGKDNRRRGTWHVAGDGQAFEAPPAVPTCI